MRLRDLAKVMDTSYDSMWAWKAGKRYPAVEHLAKIAYFFGTDTNDLLGWDQMLEELERDGEPTAPEKTPEERGSDWVLRAPRRIGDIVWDRKANPWVVVSIEWSRNNSIHLHCRALDGSGRKKSFATSSRSVDAKVFYTQEDAEEARWADVLKKKG